jgi:hypothetical protein
MSSIQEWLNPIVSYFLFVHPKFLYQLTPWIWVHVEMLLVIHILWKPKVHYNIDNILPPVPILSQMSLFHTQPTTFYLKSILILTSNEHPSLSCLSGFLIIIWNAIIICTEHATCHAHLICLALINLVLFDEYKVRSIFSNTALFPPSQFQIFSSALCSQTLSTLCCSLNLRRFTKSENRVILCYTPSSEPYRI